MYQLRRISNSSSKFYYALAVFVCEGVTLTCLFRGILEVPESVSETKTVIEGISELYVAVYPYQSSEVGDLSFEQGETITVIKKDGDWWTGTIDDRSGLFPSNYVQKVETKVHSELQKIF